jgi:hypothetical protein
MVHNAMSSRDNLFAAYNNVHPLERALVGGYCKLMLNLCICNGSIGEDVANAIKGDEDKVRERIPLDDAVRVQGCVGRATTREVPSA